MYTDQILVELSGRRRPEIVYAKQGDVAARQVEVSFLDHGQPYTIPQGTTARIRVTKPDRTYIFNDCTISGNVVTAPLTAQTLAAAGEAAVDIALYQGEDELLSCSVFRLMITPRAGSDSAAESSDEFGALDKLLQEAETSIPAATEAAEAANEAANAANTAAGDANEAAGAANSAASAANSAASSANSAATAANSAASAANTAAENADEAAQQIFDESYILTARTTFAESVEVTPTTYGNAIIEEINGATYQGPNPTPTNPQRIHGVGESGYFDGIWRVGFYSGTNGAWGEDAESLCTANFIPVKPGDVVKIEVDADTDSEHVSFYEDDGTFISRSTMAAAGVTAPANSAWMLADITYNGNAPAVDAAPFMAITINGMYAIKIKTHGKNMAFLNRKWQQNVMAGVSQGVSWTIDGENAVIFSGTATADTAIRYNQPVGDDYTKLPPIYKMKAGVTYRLRDVDILVLHSNGTIGNYQSDYVAQTGDILTGIRILATEGTAYRNRIFRPFIYEGDADAPYIPYQGNTVYIPISAPLYEGDEIVCINGEFKVVRNNAAIAADGSEDEDWGTYNAGDEATWYFRWKIAPLYESSSANYTKTKINIYTRVSVASGNTNIGANISDSVAINGCLLYVRPESSDVTPGDITAFRAFLQAHPLTAIYPLSVPVYESLPQEIMYSLVSGDEITTAELLGEDENLTLNNIIRFPRLPDGAIATSAIAKTKGRAGHVMVTDADGNTGTSNITVKELECLNGLRENVQDTLDDLTAHGTVYGKGVAVHYSPDTIILDFNFKFSASNNDTLPNDVIKLPETIVPKTDIYVVAPLLNSAWRPTGNIVYLNFANLALTPTVRLNVDSVSDAQFIGTFAFTRDDFTVSVEEIIEERPEALEFKQ